MGNSPPQVATFYPDRFHGLKTFDDSTPGDIVAMLHFCKSILKQLQYIKLSKNQLHTDNGYINITVNNGPEEQVTQILTTLVHNRKLLEGAVLLNLSQFESVASPSTTNLGHGNLHRQQAPVTSQHTPNSPQRMPANRTATLPPAQHRHFTMAYDKVAALETENIMLRKRFETDTRQTLIREILGLRAASDIHHKKVTAHEQLIQELIAYNAQLIDRLSAEMNCKLSENEGDLENIGITNRPMTVAEEYNRVKTNAWLDAKTALDEQLPEETDEKMKTDALSHILLECEKQAKHFHKTIMDSLETVLNDPSSLLSRGTLVTHDPEHNLIDFTEDNNTVQMQTASAATPSPAQSQSVVTDHELPSGVVTAVGDYFRNSADYMKIEWLNKAMLKHLKDRYRGNTRLTHLDDTAAVQDYMDQCARLAWKMVIQRPPMTFDVKHQGQLWSSSNDLDPAWNSDPHKSGARIKYYQYPVLKHEDKIMVKGTVFVN